MVCVNKVRFKAAITNLVADARDALCGGGTLTISTGKQPAYLLRFEPLHGSQARPSSSPSSLGA